MPAAVSLFYDDAQILVKIIIDRERERERGRYRVIVDFQEGNYKSEKILRLLKSEQ